MDADILTPWFKPSQRPVRDGVYLVRPRSIFGPSDCWHACRWHGRTRSWYSAGSTGSDQGDAIGWDRPNNDVYEWRGLTRAAAALAQTSSGERK